MRKFLDLNLTKINHRLLKDLNTLPTYQKRDTKIEQTPGLGDYLYPKEKKKGITIGQFELLLIFHNLNLIITQNINNFIRN